jgi:hypothetical protein
MPNAKKGHTLTSDGAIQGVALDINRFQCAFAMCLENVDSLHRVFQLTAWVNGLDGKHGIHSKLSEKVVITESGQEY